MGILSEIRARGRHVIGPVLGILAVGYFAYHALHGDRGLIAWRQLAERVEQAKLQVAEVRAQRLLLERRARLLRPDSLDPDMLEERARLMLNYGYDQDIVIIHPRRKDKD